MRESGPELRLIPGVPARPPIVPALELGGLGLGLTFTVALLARLPSWERQLGTFQGLAAVAFAFYALALLRLRAYERLPRAGAWVFAVALACRAALLPVPPTLSDDIYRYVWEGRVLAHGGDPYRAAPADASFAGLRDSVIYLRINHRELRTIYPPLALAGFGLVARVSDSVGAMKLWVVLHDLLLVLVLLRWLAHRGGNAAAAIAYAWNPLVLIEYAGSGHGEPTALLWLVLALALADRRPVLSALSLVAAVLVKLAPLAALPSLLARWPWRARLACLLPLGVGLGAFWSVSRGPDSGLDAYIRTWRNNELVFHYLARGVDDPDTARLLAAAIVLLAVAATLARRDRPERSTQSTARAAALVTPVLHPWYLGWVLVFEPWTRSPAWLLGSLTVLMSYGLLSTPPTGTSFHLPLAWRWIEYGVPLAVGLAAWTLQPSRPSRRVKNVP